MSFVHVIVPNFNYGHFLCDAIESVVVQGFTNWTLTVCDNDSEDDSVRIVLEYLKKDRRIKLLRHPANVGAFLNWKSGYQSLDTQYCLFLCADDYLNLDFLANAVAALDANPECSFFYSHYYTVDADKQIIGGMGLHHKSGIYDERYNLLFASWISPSFALIRRSALEAAGGLGLYGMEQLADQFMFYRLACQGPAYCCVEPLGYYRKHGNSHTNENIASGRAAIDQLRYADNVALYGDQPVSAILAKVRSLALLTQLDLLDAFANICLTSRADLRAYFAPHVWPAYLALLHTMAELLRSQPTLCSKSKPQQVFGMLRQQHELPDEWAQPLQQVLASIEALAT